MTIQRKRVRFRGHVQGVGFRVRVLEQARGLKIDGHVRNESDGDVLMDVQGSARDVATLIRRVQQTMASNISETLIDEREPIATLHGFQIRY